MGKERTINALINHLLGQWLGRVNWLYKGLSPLHGNGYGGFLEELGVVTFLAYSTSLAIESLNRSTVLSGIFVTHIVHGSVDLMKILDLCRPTNLAISGIDLPSSRFFSICICCFKSMRLAILINTPIYMLLFMWLAYWKYQFSSSKY